MKVYSNGDIVVIWDAAKCIHARECVKGLPQVFNRDKSPWVDMDAASSEEIMGVVDRCPSGALTYKKLGKPECAKTPSSRIRVAKNGPLLVEGECTLLDGAGKDLAEHGPFALCRCGGSKNKPFCDGTHAKIGFDDTK
ncbi:Divergent 4Fe-4S mono-cluster [uncultured archaeon]|nr:Divergent 4Fe-4S mono-cluster [uncultured archaeon]